MIIKRILFILLILSFNLIADTEILRPNGVGSATNFSQYPASGSNYDKVDEETQDSNETYVYTSSSVYDLYEVADHSTGSGTIDSVIIHVYMAREGVGMTTGHTMLRTEDSTHQGTSRFVNNEEPNYVEYTDTFTTNPTTGSAWTWDQVDAMEIGVGQGVGNLRCTQVYAVVDYTPAPTLLRIFDNAIYNAWYQGVSTYECTLSVKYTDPEGDNVLYEIQWDKNPNLTIPSSDTIGPYGSGNTVTTTIPLGSTPTEAETLFYWKARARNEWYDLDWQYRKKITINNTEVPNTDQINFPVLINRTDTDWRDISNGGHVGQSDGGDILFTSSDGTTKLDHEIEKYVPSAGSLVTWVEVDTVFNLTDTDIYIYYGNATVADQWDVSGTWDEAGNNDYKGVWHLNESSGNHLDATSYNNNSKRVAVTQQGAEIGKIDGADDFDGTNDSIVIGDSPSLDITDAITIEAWIEDSVGEKRRIVTKVNEIYVLRTDWNGQLHGYLKKGGSLYHANGPENLITTGTYHYVALTWDGVSGDNYLRLFHNGSEVSSYETQNSVTSPLDTSDDSLFIGSYGNGEWWDGLIDEVRISDVARSADWIATCYNNQNSPSTFYSIGVEEENWSPWSEVRSFTMDMDIENEYPYWYQVAGPQFEQGIKDSVTVSGDSVILESGKTYGTLRSPPIVFNNLKAENSNRNNWDGVKWTKSSADDSIGLQIEYKDGGNWSLVPDDSIGTTQGFNSIGFYNQDTNFCTVDLSELKPNIYDTLRLKAIFKSYSVKSASDPALEMLALGNTSGNITGSPDTEKPLAFVLQKNRPNPFNNRTEIRYQIPKRVKVNLQVFDIVGRSVVTLINKTQNPGYYSIRWRGVDNNKRQLPSGIYFLQMKAGDFQDTQKMLLVR